MSNCHGELGARATVGAMACAPFLGGIGGRGIGLGELCAWARLGVGANAANRAITAAAKNSKAIAAIRISERMRIRLNQSGVFIYFSNLS